MYTCPKYNISKGLHIFIFLKIVSTKNNKIIDGEFDFTIVRHYRTFLFCQSNC